MCLLRKKIKQKVCAKIVLVLVLVVAVFVANRKSGSGCVGVVLIKVEWSIRKSVENERGKQVKKGEDR